MKSVIMAESSIFSIVVGTAGHIDHGKSSLVSRLTGQDPDRLKEEKERGLTIDIGYAELVLGSGAKVGIIDVPGHEKFVRNMVAGATGIDFVILVVAADDGVMPQTREHLDILSLLGIRRGIVALSKIDLVEEDFVELAEDDVKEFLRDTFLDGAEVVRLSSVTGQGLEELKAVLDRELPSIVQERARGIFRLPVQRSFSVKGFGTVVTGVPVSGEVRVGDQVEVLPGSRPARVRGIEVYHQKAEVAAAGQRTALNLADVDYKEILRGHVVATPGFFTEARLLEVELLHLSGNRRPLANRTEVRVHVGTQDILSRVVLLDRKSLAPGERALAQLRLEEPAVVGPGDRFVIRCPSPSVTLGGGQVIGESSRRLKSFKDRVQQGLRRKLETLDDPRSYVESVLLEAGPHPVEPKDLAVRCKLPLEETRNVLALLQGEGLIHGLERDSRFVHEEGFKKAEALTVERLEALNLENPLRMGHPEREVLRPLHLTKSVWETVMKRLLARRAVGKTAAGEILLSGHKVDLTRAQLDLLNRIEATMLEAGFATPDVAELKTTLQSSGKAVDGMVDLLVQQGVLLRLRDGILLHRDKVAESYCMVVEHLARKDELLASEFKDLIGTTRKYAIPLLEHLDDVGYTRRDGSVRTLGPKGRESLENAG